MASLQHAVRGNSQDRYREFATAINKESDAIDKWNKVMKAYLKLPASEQKRVMDEESKNEESKRTHVEMPSREDSQATEIAAANLAQASPRSHRS